MTLPALVDVLPTAAHVDERLLRALEDGRSALAPSTVTVDELVAVLFAALVPDARIAPAALERLVIAAALRRALAGDGARPAREHTGTVDAMVRAVDALHRHGVSGDDVVRAVAEVPADNAPARARLELLADVAREAERALSARRLVTRASAEAHLASALDRLAPEALLPAPLDAHGVVVRVHAAQDLDPSRVALWLALARALRRRGGRLELHALSEPRRERTPPALDRALRAFEAAEDLPIELAFGLRDAAAPAQDPRLAELVAAMGTGGVRVHGAPVALAEAYGPDEEARWVAARVERWLAEGYAPHEIAVVVREGTPEALAPLVRALDDARVPWREACGAPLTSSAVARAALSLPRIVARGAPREEVVHALAVLTGQVRRAGGVAPYRVAQALRQLGIDSFLDPELDARLAEPGRRQPPAAVVRAAREIADELWRLLPDADAATHAARLVGYIERLGGVERSLAESHAVMASASYDPGAQAIARAIARDEAALRAALELLAELPFVVPDPTATLPVGAFADLLADVAAARALPPATAAGASAVLIAPARQMAGRSVRAVAVVGLNDGGFPGRPADESLLGEVECGAILRAAGRLVARAGGREDETLLFLGVVACATDALALSGARHDVGGRALPPSPFMADARRAAGTAPSPVPRDPLARSPEVPPRGAERATRAWVQAPAAPPPALAAPVRSARGRAAIERERREFFSGRRAEPGRYTGRIDHHPRLVAALGLPAYGSAHKPVDVTTLERAARCGFRAFAQGVLGLEAPVETPPTLDAKERGHLLHKLVEAGQGALRAARALPTEARLAAVARALDEAGADFIEREPHADPALLAADLAAIRAQVEAWLRGRMEAEDRWEMLETEVAFGPEKKWPALEVPVDSGDAIVIHGRIDGVERMDDRVRVVEFKSGRGDGYAKRLRDGVLDTQFQLVVYTAALARASRHGAVQVPGTIDGLYVGFRDHAEASLREVLAPRARRRRMPLFDVDALLDDGARGEGAVAAAVRGAIEPLRRGVFPPRPRSCEFCDVGSLCRIEAHEGGGDD